MDAASYHVARAGEIVEEFSAEEFRRQRSAGKIKPTDHFWTLETCLSRRKSVDWKK